MSLIVLVSLLLLPLSVFAQQSMQQADCAAQLMQALVRSGQQQSLALQDRNGLAQYFEEELTKVRTERDKLQAELRKAQTDAAKTNPPEEPKQ